MSTIEDVVTAYKNRLAAQVTAAEQLLVAAYADVWQSLSDDARKLAERIAALDEPSAAQVLRLAEYRTLEAQVAAEVGRIAAGLHPTLTMMQAEAVVLGSASAQAQLSALGVTSAVRLPNTAMVDMIGRLQTGSPLRTVLDRLPAHASASVRQSLVTSVGAGWDVPRTSRAIRDSLGGNMSRANTIARTEIVGSHRRANLRTYQANANVLEGWVWVAAVDNVMPPPCPVCIGMHGTVHPLDEPFGSHPNCRCVPSPLVKGDSPFVPTGDEWVKDQSDEAVIKIYGQDIGQRVVRGDLKPSDLVKRLDDPEWGLQHRVKSRRELGLTR